MPTPEELELKEKNLQLSDIQNELAQFELEFATLHGELNDFQYHYTKLVVRRMYELDRIEQQIAEYLISTAPASVDYREKLKAAKERISESEKVFKSEKRRSGNGKFQPSDSLKKLYREIARKIHPDLATDEKERQRRGQLMAEINDAYEIGDEQKMRQTLDEWQNDPDNVQGEDVGAELIKAIRKIAQMQRRIAAIQEEIKILKSTEIYELKEKVEQSEKDGLDLLGQMVDYLDVQIHEREEYLKFLQTGGKGHL